MARAPRLLATGLAVLLTAGSAAAQAGPGDERLPLRERILAVVGEDLLLESQWREQTSVLATQLGVEPGSREYRSLAEETFDQMLNEMVIVAAARRDTTIEIPEERVIEAVDSDIEEIQSRFPSEEAFLQQLSRSQWGSLAAYRADLQERKRRELLGQAYLDRHRGEIEPPEISDAEVRAYWEENREAFPTRPETVTFEEIPVQVEPDEEDVEEARQEIERILSELRAGKNFDAAAKQYSDDETADRGGDLGWFGRGQMVEAFEEAAFSADPGELVGPVRTPFGFHVLQVVDRRPEEARARHILVGFEYEDEDVERAREEARRIAELILAGADVDSLQAERMPGDSAGAAPLEIPLEQLPPPYRQALEGLEPDEAEVVELAVAGRDVPAFNVVVLRGREGGGVTTFEEMEPRIRRQLEQQRAEDVWVERLRDRVYVEVRIPPEEALSS